MPKKKKRREAFDDPSAIERITSDDEPEAPDDDEPAFDEESIRAAREFRMARPRTLTPSIFGLLRAGSDDDPWSSKDAAPSPPKADP